MKIQELIGKQIKDIRVKITRDGNSSDALIFAESYIVLTTGEAFKFPYFDVRNIGLKRPAYESYSVKRIREPFEFIFGLFSKYHSVRNFNFRNKKITGIYYLANEGAGDWLTYFFELNNRIFVGEKHSGLYPLGDAGVYVFHSKEDLIETVYCEVEDFKKLDF